ncbi:MAG: phage tail tape measure protein [Bacteroidetes bacterium]|nr:phage tail tape measure protein [Bacteroidota bacterium]
MSNTLEYIIKINSNFDKANAQFSAFEKNFKGGIDNINKSLSQIKVQSIISNIDSVANGIMSVNDPGLKLSSSLADLSAITGQTGDKLKEIEGYARQNAKTFGGSAADGVEAYKLILSQLTPEIAKQPKALEAMGKSVSTLSKTMDGDTVKATEVLTTAMNQYQVSLDDPIRASQTMADMMNIMAAGAKEGSAELPQIKNALEQSGLAAKTANVSFAETNAAIQVLDKSGKKGAEGGVALRNVLATLSEGRFLPKEVKKELSDARISVDALGDRSKSLKERLDPLKKIMGDQALLTKLFGKENTAAAISLISGTNEMERLTKAIQGTNTAYEQAAVVMESPAEKNKRLQAQIDDFKISLFNGTNGLLGYATVIGNTTRDFSNMLPLFQAGSAVLSTLTSATKMQALWSGAVSTATQLWTGVQMIFNAVMAANPIVLIVAGVVALISAIVYVAQKTEGWGKLWTHTVNGAKLLFGAYVQYVKSNFNLMVSGIMIGIDKIMIGWYKFKNLAGLGDKNANNAEIAKLNADVEARKESIKAGYKKTYEMTMASANEFKKAFNSVSWKKDEQKAATSSGIEAPKIPGVNTDLQPNRIAPEKVKKSSENIATGGTKHNYITISIKELNGIKAGVVQAGKEAANKAGGEVLDEILRLLASATTATS